MRVSQLLGKVMKDVNEQGSTSHELLVRAGYVRQLGSGLFIYMHLAKRMLDKISSIINEEMNEIGGVEVNMPIVQSADNWIQTGRYSEIDNSLVRFNDRHDRKMVLAMTHEEVVGFLGSLEIESYRDLPKLVYQIQTKVRDEKRPRAGLIRGREFIMKDSYSFDASWDGLEVQYNKHIEAYHRIFKRLGLPAVSIESDTGMMGGRVAHEFMYFSEIGEDSIYSCASCGYRANKEIARFKKEVSTKSSTNLVLRETRGVNSIKDLCDFLGVKAEETAKSVMYMVKIGAKERLVLCMVRGDMMLNEVKLQNLLKGQIVRLANQEELRSYGVEGGYASSYGLDLEKLIVVVDDLLTEEKSLVIGANQLNHHYTGAQFNRDFFANHVGDIAECTEGQSCHHCGSDLTISRGVEVGNIFQLGTKYSESLGAFFIDENGKKQAAIMGSYGIGVSRVLACLADYYQDEKGLVFHEQIAPYSVQVISVAENEEVVIVAEELYQNLKAKGVEVLYDDRHKRVASAGQRFKDFEIRGIPKAIVVSKRTLMNGQFEVIDRKTGEKNMVDKERIYEAVIS